MNWVLLLIVFIMCFMAGYLTPGSLGIVRIRKALGFPWYWQLRRAMIKDWWVLENERQVWVLHLRKSEDVFEISDEMIRGHVGSGIHPSCMTERLRQMWFDLAKD